MPTDRSPDRHLFLNTVRSISLVTVPNTCNPLNSRPSTSSPPSPGLCKQEFENPGQDPGALSKKNGLSGIDGEPDPGESGLVWARVLVGKGMPTVLSEPAPRSGRIKHSPQAAVDRYLIETPHAGAKCLALIKQLNAQGYLRNFDWGSKTGVHSGWAIIEAENEAQARLAVPPLLRSWARIVKLDKFDGKTIEDHETLEASVPSQG